MRQLIKWNDFQIDRMNIFSVMAIDQISSKAVKGNKSNSAVSLNMYLP